MADEKQTINRIETDTDPVSQCLENFSDGSLYKVTTFYRNRLEQAIEEAVKGVSLVLTYEGYFNGQEHQKVTELADNGEQAESTKLLLNLVIEKDAGARRMMWKSFVKMRNGVPKLDKILAEIEQIGPSVAHYADCREEITELPKYLKDAQEQHKEILRQRNETLDLNTILIKEKVKISHLNARYTELTIISPVRHRKLIEHELIARGRDHEEWREMHLRRELEKIRIDQLFRSCFSQDYQCHTGKGQVVQIHSGCSVVVSGVPGIGKTTLLQKIVYDWASGNIYPHFQFVFSFKFHELNTINWKSTLKEMILLFYPYLEKFVEDLWKNPASLLFIFDGLDEFKDSIEFLDSQSDAAPQSICMDPEIPCKVSDIVSSLIQKQLLPGCSVLLTSRPSELQLLEKADISVWAEILGFVGEERKEYFQKCFGDQTVAAAVFKHVEENEILYTMCYNPSYCWILCLSLGPFYTQGNRKQQQVPRTITQLYSYYIYNLLKNHGRGIENPRDVLLKIGEMALTGVFEKQIVFRNEDLIKYNLQPSQFLSGFMLEIFERNDSARCVVYTFLHLTIQEFVAALAQFLTPNLEDIQELLNNVQSKEDGRFEIFLRFVAGLSSPQAARPLEELVGPFLHQTTCRVIDWVQEKVEKQIGNTGSKSGKRDLLNTLHYLFESQNKALAQTTLGSVERLQFGDSDSQKALQLSPIDCAVLSHAIGLCHTIKHLDLRNCYIQSEGLQRLEPSLHKCQVLRLEGNDLDDSGMQLLCLVLKHPKCKIEALGLADNGLTASCTENLSFVLSTNRSLKGLYLGYNNLGCSGVKHLSVALKHLDCEIQKLALNDNELTDSCVKDLTSALSTNRSLTELNLNNNKLGDSGVILLSDSLRKPDCKIQELRLADNALTDSCIKVLASALSTSRSLTVLSLWSNSLTDQSIPALSHLILNCESLQCIWIGENSFTSNGEEQLHLLQKSRSGFRVEM
ncbi:NACHT, LRR and PYD domains-containing protein 3-like isoform X2 [Rhincodon typus]|uniref:NACHT, LRR and PYD domains-containing protein 3-like isoform X2 n=1 Tax=Rhincodon typus TaxID=259920 RepID=UPI00202DC242|nr:NACHT, LRR and PYD domains-containing protein 3-like isoform X2 [Rhincodon typus]